MNLYNFFNEPESLNHYDLAHKRVPRLIWKTFISNYNEIKKYEKYIALDPVYAYRYAREVINKPFPEGENAIAKNKHNAYLYAKFILRGPFPKGEDAIAQSGQNSFFYARDMLEARFPKGEKKIKEESQHYWKLYKRRFGID